MSRCYDGLDNLKTWTLAGVKDHHYYYDPTEKRLTNINTGTGVGIVGLGYDVQGNLQQRNGQGYQFDYGNRLREVTGKETYRYDGHGRRVLAWSSTGGNILSQYSQSGQLVFQQDQRQGKNIDHVYLAGSLVATREHNYDTGVTAVRYQHTDALGSPLAVTNEAGQVLERTQFEPFGAAIGRTIQGVGYTGHVMDAVTGLTYMQQRYYDPTIGRFLSVDPVTANGNTGGNFNRYWYANNNPYKFSDPDGRFVRSPLPSLLDDFRRDRVRHPWDDFQLAKRSQSKQNQPEAKRSLPSTSKLKAAYPRFGQVPSARPSANPAYVNQCAIRASVALEGAGFSLDGYPEVNQTAEGWARSAKGLADYLTQEVGKPSVVSYDDFRDASSPVNYSNFRGIFFQTDVPHIDVMDRGYTGSGIHGSQGDVWLWPTD